MTKRIKKGASILFGSVLATTSIGCRSNKGLVPIVEPQRLDWSNATERDSWGRVYDQYQSSARLIAAWTPPNGSAWKPFFKPTLLASVDEMWYEATDGQDRNAARALLSPATQQAMPAASNFARSPVPEKTAVFFDLPGEESLAWGVALAQNRGFQPVVTFNNWPHHNGVLPAHRILGTAIYFASGIEELKQTNKIQASSAPAFLLDSNRLSLEKDVDSSASTYDNRYYLTGSDLPSAAQLKEAGIDHIAYVTRFNGRQQAEVREQDDLNEYFAALSNGGIDFAIVAAEAFQDQAPQGQTDPEPSPSPSTSRQQQGNASGGGSFDDRTENEPTNTAYHGGGGTSPWLWYWLGTRGGVYNNYYYGGYRGGGGYYGAAPYRPQARSTFFQGGQATGRAAALMGSPGGGGRAASRAATVPSMRGSGGGFGGSRGYGGGG